MGQAVDGLGLPAPLAGLQQAARGALIGGDEEGVAGQRKLREAEDLDGRGRAGLPDAAAGVGDHGLDAAECVADDEIVANVQGALLHEDGGQGALALVELGLDDHAAGGAVGVGP